MLARSLVQQPLLTKLPGLLVSAPVDLLFVLNGHVAHPKYQACLLQGGEGTAANAVDFRGVDLSDRAPLPKHVEAKILATAAPDKQAALLQRATANLQAKNAAKRLEVVRFVLSALTDEQRIEVTARFAHEVLFAVVQGSLPLNTNESNSPAHAVLRAMEVHIESMRIQVGVGVGVGESAVSQSVLYSLSPSLT